MLFLLLYFIIIIILVILVFIFWGSLTGCPARLAPLTFQTDICWVTDAAEIRICLTKFEITSKTHSLGI